MNWIRRAFVDESNSLQVWIVVPLALVGLCLGCWMAVLAMAPVTYLTGKWNDYWEFHPPGLQQRPAEKTNP